jgi:hypothetical protein
MKSGTAVDIFEQFLNTIKKLGIPKTEQILIQSQKYENPDDFIKILCIEKLVCSEFNISSEYLKNEKQNGDSNKGSGNRRDAASVYIYFLNKYLTFRESDVIKIVKFSERTYHNNLKYIKSLDPKICDHRNLLERIHKIEANIELQFKTI